MEGGEAFEEETMINLGSPLTNDVDVEGSWRHQSVDNKSKFTFE